MGTDDRFREDSVDGSGASQLTLQIDGVAMVQLLGTQDRLLKTVETQFPLVDVSVRSNKITLTAGSTADDLDQLESARKLVEDLVQMVRDGMPIGEHEVKESAGMIRAGVDSGLAGKLSPAIVSARGKSVRPKTSGQREYVDAIDSNTIVFGIGPAGTGKTYLAMAKAVQALQRKEVNRIVLTRPAVETGERLGYLPGTLSEKIDPYLRPLFDALNEMMDPDLVIKLLASGIIEVAPLAYMRGRTLNDSFIVLDEAQNTTPEQMKMFLTRLGFGSRIVVTGDVTQIDLPAGGSGLNLVTRVLCDIDDIHFATFTSADVVRHSLVGRIVEAYAEYDALKQQARHPDT